MMIELIILIISALCLVALYFGRMKSVRQGSSVLFSDTFLNKSDENIFEFIKFIFKLYMLLVHNIKSLYTTIPHKIADKVHNFSHALALKSKTWVEAFKNKPNLKDK